MRPAGRGAPDQKPGRTFEYSQSGYADTDSARACGDLGHHRGRIPHCRDPVPRRRHQRRRRWLPGQTFRHDHGARRLSRPARRQGDAGVDLYRARHHRGDPALVGDPGRVPRHHDRQRGDSLLGRGQAGAAQAADGLQAQHRRANRAGLRGAGHSRLRFPRRRDRARARGAGHGPHAPVRRILSRRMGAPHERCGKASLNPQPGGLFG